MLKQTDVHKCIYIYSAWSLKMCKDHVLWQISVELRLKQIKKIMNA